MTTNHDKSYIGIDISKNKFDVFCLPSRQHHIYQNNDEGFKAFLKYLKSLDNHHKLIVCEATGGYENELAYFLQQENFQMVIMNPKKIRDFGKALGILAKTDKQDAKLIALFAERVQPRYYEKHFHLRHLSELHQRQQQVKELLQAEKNRLEHTTKATRSFINKHIKFLEKELEAIEKKLDDEIAKNDDLQDKMDILQSYKGVGKTTARTLLIGLPELGNIAKKPLAALVGVAPLNKDSGKMTGKRFVWGGRQNIRKSLYMATLVATKHNPVIKQFYLKLVNAGKAKKLALIACMRKLIIILNAMIKNRQPWQDKTILN